MNTIVCNVSLGAYVLIVLFIFLIAWKMNKIPSFRRLPGSFKAGAVHLLILIAIVISAFSFDIFSRYEYRICTLAFCLFPVTLKHSTYGPRSIKRDIGNAEDESDASQILKYSRVISIACFASYIVYIPFTLYYLQII